MVEEENLDGGPRGGGKEELGEEKLVSVDTLSLRKTKIWKSYSTSLELNRREEIGFFVCLEMKEKESLYSSGGGNMNRRPFNEG